MGGDTKEVRPIDVNTSEYTSGTDVTLVLVESLAQPPTTEIDELVFKKCRDEHV